MQENVGIIRNSNLCCEVLLYSDEKEYAVCTLASIALTNFVNESGVFEHNKLLEVLPVIVRNLNKVIDYNFYPTPETKLSNLTNRPLGIGVQGFNDALFKMRIPYDSQEARDINKEIFETIYYGAVKASMELAKEIGSYKNYEGSPYSKGILQFDMWNVTPSNRYNWDELKENIKKHGIANSTLIALMPTASTSQILGNNECFEPITSNIYTRSTIAGDFVVINKYLVKDLMNRGLWNKDMKDNIIAENGSIQNIQEIPEDLKNLYKTVWEIKQKALIDLSIERGPYVCQTQSLNLFFEEPEPQKLTGALVYGWKNGLKTGSYYIRSRPKVQAQQFTIDPNKKKELEEKKKMLNMKKEDEQVCESCSA
jgi:ribonucleoside-diphosphate reductase alpha chain